MITVRALSDTQLRILRAVEARQRARGGQGLPMREIAVFAGVSYETVKLHVPRMVAWGCLQRKLPAVSSPGRPYCYEVLVDVDRPA